MGRVRRAGLTLAIAVVIGGVVGVLRTPTWLDARAVQRIDAPDPAARAAAWARIERRLDHAPELERALRNRLADVDDDALCTAADALRRLERWRPEHVGIEVIVREAELRAARNDDAEGRRAAALSLRTLAGHAVDVTPVLAALAQATKPGSAASDALVETACALAWPDHPERLETIRALAPDLVAEAPRWFLARTITAPPPDPRALAGVVDDPAQSPLRRRLAAWLAGISDRDRLAPLLEGPVADDVTDVIVVALLGERAAADPDRWLRDLDDARKRAGMILCALTACASTALEVPSDDVRTNMVRRVASAARRDPRSAVELAWRSRADGRHPADVLAVLLASGDLGALARLTDDHESGRAARLMLIERFCPDWPWRRADAPGDTARLFARLDVLRRLTTSHLRFDETTRTFRLERGPGDPPAE